jgi:hypothetical protein
MRFHSTPQSALNGEITKLAILECAASVALYLGICAHFGTLKYLARAVVVAPLMLFRTEASADWALKAYRQWFLRVDVLMNRLFDSKNRFALFGNLAILLAWPIVGAAIRIVGTVYWAL